MNIIKQYTTKYGFLEVRKVLAWNKAWNFCIPLGFYKDSGFKTFEEYQLSGEIK